MLDAFRLTTIAPVVITRHFLALLGPGSRLMNMTMPSRPIGALPRTGASPFVAGPFVAGRDALTVLTRMIANELGGARSWWRCGRGTCTPISTATRPRPPPLDQAIARLVDPIERLGPADHGACLLLDGTQVGW
jgi:hypothetical protein